MKKIIETIPLIINGRKLVVNNSIEQKQEELDEFVEYAQYTNTIKFSEDVLFSHEIHANNYIEGYKDDVETIDQVIHKSSAIKDKEKKQRIINLYKGYKYILQRNPIDRESLKCLYSILSEELLCKEDILNMGNYYRKNDVYIFYSNNPDKYDKGEPSEKIEDYMEMLLEYANTNNSNLSKTEKFLKSQIMHFYFVFIHPYYDINGRTSRTMSMWYLLNNNDYPFIIFNRAIQLNKAKYYKKIIESKRNLNVTPFLEYMLEYTREELEKDNIINMIKQSTPYSLTSLDFQTIHYILSMKSNITYLDFVEFYNNQNDKKKQNEIIEMIYSLLEKGIIIEGPQTQKQVGEINNHFFTLNPNLFEIDPQMIKKIQLPK